MTPYYIYKRNKGKHVCLPFLFYCPTSNRLLDLRLNFLGYIYDVRACVNSSTLLEDISIVASLSYSVNGSTHLG